MNFADYHYYANMAPGATYTPPAQAIATWFRGPVAKFRDLNYNVELWDGGGWVSSQQVGEIEGRCSINQDAAQNLRVNWEGGNAKNMTLTGVIWA